MATVNKVLTAINEEIILDIPTDRTAICGLQYGAGGLGTVELQGTMDAGVTWFTIQLSKPDGTAAALSLVAAGQGYAEVGYCDRVRAKKTVAGAGPVTTTLNLATRAA